MTIGTESSSDELAKLHVLVSNLESRVEYLEQVISGGNLQAAKPVTNTTTPTPATGTMDISSLRRQLGALSEGLDTLISTHTKLSVHLLNVYKLAQDGDSGLTVRENLGFDKLTCEHPSYQTKIDVKTNERWCGGCGVRIFP
jgi:hypothetical protein